MNTLNRLLQFGQLLCALFPFIFQNTQVFPVFAFLLPLDTMFQHDFSQCFFFSLHPYSPLCHGASFACDALIGKGLFQRYTGGKTSLASGGIWNEVNVKMGRGFVHVQMGREHMKMGISLLEASHEFVQNSPCQFPVLAGGRHIILVSNLEDHLIKWLFLISVADFLVIVFDAPVFAFLFGVVRCQSFIEQLMISLLDGCIAVSMFRCVRSGSTFSAI